MPSMICFFSGLLSWSAHFRASSARARQWLALSIRCGIGSPPALLPQRTTVAFGCPFDAFCSCVQIVRGCPPLPALCISTELIQPFALGLSPIQVSCPIALSLESFGYPVRVRVVARLRKLHRSPHCFVLLGGHGY